MGVGFCAYPAQGEGTGLLTAAFKGIKSGQIPPPLAFYPLTGRSLSAIGVPRYTGARSQSAVWVKDAAFGEVLFCNKVL